MTVTLLTYIMRFFLSKGTTVILLTLGLTSWAQDMGIHPGVLLLTILMAIECWFLTTKPILTKSLITAQTERPSLMPRQES